MLKAALLMTMLVSLQALAKPCKNGAYETFALGNQGCAPAIIACENVASVTDPKTGMTGYCPGEWKDGATAATGMGLWADCIAPLAKGKNPALGGLQVTPALTASAHACSAPLKAAYCAQNPTAPRCQQKKK